MADETFTRAEYGNAERTVVRAWPAEGPSWAVTPGDPRLQGLEIAEFASGAAPGVRYVPVYLARQRLEAAGLWEAAAEVLASQPAKMLKVLSLEAGIATNDPDALELLTVIGADPAEILAA
jgi:hypothetical protein